MIVRADYILKVLHPKNELVLASLLALYCAYYLIVSLNAAWGFTTDDAYISWLYARQLVQGHGLQWHELLPRVEGYSNFLWVMLSSLVLKLQWPLADTMKWISCFSLVAGLIFLYRLGRLFFSPLLAMLPVFLFSRYTGVIWWTVSGLESTFFCALALLLIWQCAIAFDYIPASSQKKRTFSWLITSIVLLLLSMTRFEGLVWSVPIAFFALCQLRRNGLTGFAGGYTTLGLWGCITFCCFLLPYAFYFMWRMYYFGHWIPNSYQCKAAIAGQVGVVDLDYLQLLIPFIVASLPYFLSGSKDCKHLLLWLPSLLYGLMLWRADPILAHLLRLFLAPFALFSLLPVLGIEQFMQYFKQLKCDSKLLTCGCMLILTIVFIPATKPSYLHALAADYHSRNQSRAAISNMINAQAKQGDTVLLGDCGLIPFNARSDIRFIDSQCLNNIALTKAPYNNLGLYADYLREQLKPDWVIANKPLIEARGDALLELLAKQHFFVDYQLVATLKSGAVLPGTDSGSKKMIDYIYLVYKRN